MYEELVDEYNHRLHNHILEVIVNYSYLSLANWLAFETFPK